MKQRVEVGTDIARIGVWDACLNGETLSHVPMKQFEKLLAAVIDQGRLFLIQLSGDWGGFVDVYVNSSLESAVREQMKEFAGKFLISAPSGRIIVSGAEDYRSTEAEITSESSLVLVDPGDYALKCFALESKETEIQDMPEPKEIEAAVGSEIYAHYEMWRRRTTRGFWLPLLIFPLTYWAGWIVGPIATLAIFVAFFHLAEWFQNRDPRYAEANAAVEAAICAGQDSMPPMFALELRRLETRHQLSGGRVEVCDA